MRRVLWLALVAVGVALVAAPAGRAADQEAIQKAIERGVAALKEMQRPDGTWPYDEIGATALAGLTLVECGVAADDPAVQKAAEAVRATSIRTTKTYSLALTVLFLDRLGDPSDVPFLESTAIKLLAGQSAATGGWTYDCPQISDAEMRRLETILKQRTELVAGKEPRPAKEPRTVRDLPKEIQDQLTLINRQVGVPMGASDNSNTQFATLALWVAHRHGLPVETALRRIDARFRTSQSADGGWSYMPPIGRPPGVPVGMIPPGMGSTPSMTCAGLLGLAVAYGKANEDKPAAARDPNKDPAIRAGLIALGTAIGDPVGKQAVALPQPRQPGPFPPGVVPGMPQDPRFRVPMLGPRANGKGYYFLWSLERVAVAYGLDRIGGKDWYAWGAEILLNNQTPNGSWQGDYGAYGADTCFALLFLRRANLAADLSATLKDKVKDPDARELKAGGFGGEELAKQKLGLKPAFDNTKPEHPNTGEGSSPPSGGGDGDAAQLGEELVKAAPEQQEGVLAKLRDAKGGTYTEALSSAIARLSGPVKARAREALAERLTRMTSKTLADKLRDDDLEIRRAAALAVAMKEDRTHVPRLIELLEDSEAPVAHAAHAALKSLSGQDFGPEPEASRADRVRAVAAWKAWWTKQAQ